LDREFARSIKGDSVTYFRLSATPTDDIIHVNGLPRPSRHAAVIA
jgi:hypothetical protein